MYSFVVFAPALALLLGQAEPADQGGAAAPAGQEAAEPAAPSPAPSPTPSPPPPARPGDAAPTPERAAARPAEPERTQVARAALAFLDALVAADAGRLAAASGERFSFDGEVRSGKDEIRRTWQGLLASRETAERPALLDLELLPAADAVARLGAPPPRLAPLVAATGTWVAVANVSRRPVVLVLAREGVRWTVVGME